MISFVSFFHLHYCVTCILLLIHLWSFTSVKNIGYPLPYPGPLCRTGSYLMSWIPLPCSGTPIFEFDLTLYWYSLVSNNRVLLVRLTLKEGLHSFLSHLRDDFSLLWHSIQRINLSGLHASVPIVFIFLYPYPLWQHWISNCIWIVAQPVPLRFLNWKNYGRTVRWIV